MKTIITTLHRTLYVVLALIVIFSSNIVFAVTGSSNPPKCEGFVCCSGPDCNFDSFKYSIEHIIKYALNLAFVAIALMVAYAGYLYMTSGGDSGKRQEAHEMFHKVVIGILVVLLAFLIVEIITSTLGLDTSIIKLIT